jgi:hypothetical protein
VTQERFHVELDRVRQRLNRLVVNETKECLPIASGRASESRCRKLQNRAGQRNMAKRRWLLSHPSWDGYRQVGEVMQLLTVQLSHAHSVGFSRRTESEARYVARSAPRPPAAKRRPAGRRQEGTLRPR